MASGDITATRAKVSDYPCAVFDGIDDYIEIPFNANFNFKSEIKAISFWIKTEVSSQSYPKIIGSGAYAHNGWVIVQNQDGTVISMGFADGTGWTDSSISAIAITKGIWTNIIYVFNSSTIDGYKNGVLIANDAIPTYYTNTNQNLVFGADSRHLSPGRTKLRDIRFYNKIPTSEEITELSQGQNVSRGLFHHWKLENDYNDSVGTAHGTNNGTYLTNTLPNKIKADVESLNLAAATDKIIVLPVSGRDGTIKIIKAERAA